MVASPEMRAIRELPLAASLLLVGLALFFGGGPRYGSLPWLGGGALLAIVVLIITRGLPAPRAARGAGWMACALDLLVCGPRSLVGLREPHACLSPVCRAGALARRPDAR